MSIGPRGLALLAAGLAGDAVRSVTFDSGGTAFELSTRALRLDPGDLDQAGNLPDHYLALLLHELAHALSPPPELPPHLPRSAGRLLWNALEDGRAETLASRLWPGAGVRLRALRGAHGRSAGPVWRQSGSLYLTFCAAVLDLGTSPTDEPAAPDPVLPVEVTLLLRQTHRQRSSYCEGTGNLDVLLSNVASSAASLLRADLERLRTSLELHPHELPPLQGALEASRARTAGRVRRLLRTLRSPIRRVGPSRGARPGDVPNRALLALLQEATARPWRGSGSATLHGSRLGAQTFDFRPVAAERDRVVSAVLGSRSRKWAAAGSEIDLRRLVRFEAGRDPDWRIWHRRGDAPPRHEAIVLLLDLSGSMEGPASQQALWVALVTAQACETVGIARAIFGYQDRLVPLVDFDEPLLSQRLIDAAMAEVAGQRDGGNNRPESNDDAPCIAAALARTLPRFRRPTMLVLTDGDDAGRSRGVASDRSLEPLARGGLLICSRRPTAREHLLPRLVEQLSTT